MFPDSKWTKKTDVIISPGYNQLTNQTAVLLSLHVEVISGTIPPGVKAIRLYMQLKRELHRDLSHSPLSIPLHKAILMYMFVFGKSNKYFSIL